MQRHRQREREKDRPKTKRERVRDHQTERERERQREKERGAGGGEREKNKEIPVQNFDSCHSVPQCTPWQRQFEEATEECQLDDDDWWWWQGEERLEEPLPLHFLAAATVVRWLEDAWCST